MVGADRAAIDQVERLRRQVEALAAELAGQAERLERLRTRLVAKRARSSPASTPSATTPSG